MAVTRWLTRRLVKTNFAKWLSRMGGRSVDLDEAKDAVDALKIQGVHVRGISRGKGKPIVDFELVDAVDFSSVHPGFVRNVLPGTTPGVTGLQQGPSSTSFTFPAAGPEYYLPKAGPSPVAPKPMDPRAITRATGHQPLQLGVPTARRGLQLPATTGAAPARPVRPSVQVGQRANLPQQPTVGVTQIDPRRARGLPPPMVGPQQLPAPGAPGTMQNTLDIANWRPKQLFEPGTFTPGGPTMNKLLMGAGITAPIVGGGIGALMAPDMPEDWTPFQPYTHVPGITAAPPGQPVSPDTGPPPLTEEDEYLDMSEHQRAKAAGSTALPPSATGIAPAAAGPPAVVPAPGGAGPALTAQAESERRAQDQLGTAKLDAVGVLNRNIDQHNLWQKFRSISQPQDALQNMHPVAQIVYGLSKGFGGDPGGTALEFRQRMLNRNQVHAAVGFLQTHGRDMGVDVTQTFKADGGHTITVSPTEDIQDIDMFTNEMGPLMQAMKTAGMDGVIDTKYKGTSIRLSLGGAALAQDDKDWQRIQSEQAKNRQAAQQGMQALQQRSATLDPTGTYRTDVNAQTQQQVAMMQYAATESRERNANIRAWMDSGGNLQHSGSQLVVGYRKEGPKMPWEKTWFSRHPLTGQLAITDMKTATGQPFDKIVRDAQEQAFLNDKFGDSLVGFDIPALGKAGKEYPHVELLNKHFGQAINPFSPLGASGQAPATGGTNEPPVQVTGLTNVIDTMNFPAR